MTTADTPSPKKPASRKSSKPRAKPLIFPTIHNSPFHDGYDIKSEERNLQHLIAADEPDASDPLYDRYAEYERRLEILRQQVGQHRLTGGAQPEVPVNEALAVKNIGKLTDEEDDTMALHTREASRLFVGRAKQPGESGYGQSGGKKVGAALRAIWYLSANDNPYADYALIEAHSEITRVGSELEKHIDDMEQALKKLVTRGLRYSIVKAAPPAEVQLGFRSPYGYAVVKLISTFDYYVRLVKTMTRKDLRAEKEGYNDIYTMGRKCRSIFEKVVNYQRYLMRDELRPLSRIDWLPTADAQARKRVTAAVALFGELPREVFNGSVEPRHSRRQLDLTHEELRMLNEVPLAGDEPAQEVAVQLQ